jgi:hypothetical protein
VANASNPITPPFSDGKPESATRAGAPVTAPFLAGDKLIYDKLRDITVGAAVTLPKFYDDTYLYNNEIYYDSVEDLTSFVTAINLRKLVFNLTPV